MQINNKGKSFAMNSMTSLPSFEDPSPDIPSPDNHSPEDPDPVADPVPGNSLSTIKGRNKGEQKVHDGYVYSHNKTNVSNGNRYWLCKDSKKHSPTCKGRLTTNDGQVIKTTPHCHEPSETDAGSRFSSPPSELPTSRRPSPQ